MNSREVPLGWFTWTLRKFSKCYVELLFLAISLRMLGLIEPFIFQVVIDRILPFQREHSLIVVVMVFIVAGMFQFCFSLLSQILSLRTANDVTNELGSRLYHHLFHLPYKHFRTWSVGETIARVSETDTIRSFIVGVATGTLLDLVFVVVYIAVLFSISTSLSLIVIISLPLQLLVYFLFGPAIRRRMRAQFDAGASLQNRMVENLTGINAIKALNMENEVVSRLETSLDSTLTAGYRVGILSIISGRLTFIIQRSVTSLIILVGAQAVFNGEMTLGQLIAFHLLVDKITGPIANFSRLWESWQNIRVSRQRLGDILNVPPEPFDSAIFLPPEISPQLSFGQVGFSYSNNEPILNNMSFHAAPGTLSLVVGDTGSGKSTFARLAAGIEQPLEGVVFLDNLDISKYNPESVRANIAYVPQDAYLFAGTIRENLSLGDAGVSEQQLVEALHNCAAENLLVDLPLGLDTDVGDRGSSLSGGQRQKIAIARCLVRLPKVLILDEPTSAMDKLSIEKFASKLEGLKPLMTIIIVTHQPENFTSVDQIIEFGKI